MRAFPEIAGCVWEDKISLPSLTIAQIKFLKRFHINWTADDGISIEHLENKDGFEGDIEHLTPYFEMAARDINVVNQCKNSVPKRKHWFLENKDLSVLPHFDAKARNIWLHRHINGAGLRIFYPTDNKKIEIANVPRVGPVVHSSTLKKLFEREAISSFDLKEHEVIVFNETLLHASNDGNRFRSVVNGYG
jgi:hypothetical protein